MTPNIHDIPGIGGFYTKKEVDDLIKAAVDEAKEIDLSLIHISEPTRPERIA